MGRMFFSQEKVQ